MVYQALRLGIARGSEQGENHQRRAWVVAASLLGTHGTRRNGLSTSHRIHSFQSSETRICKSPDRFAVFQFSPLRQNGNVSAGLGRQGAGFLTVSVESELAVVGLRRANPTYPEL